jgi:dTDP-4-dehydrorhamnose 3,5-epimerase
MEVTTTALAGVLIVQPKVFADARGFFLESFNQRQFDAAVGAHAQGKLVRVTSGRIFDIAVDVRIGSPTYRQWVGLELDDVGHRQLWIPPGLAHGFLVMSESADVQYKTTDYYMPAAEVGIRWDDPALAIAWPDLGTPYILSAKDQVAPTLDQALASR